MRTACSIGVTKILPSPICPVRAAAWSCFHHLIELLAGDGDFEAQLGKKIHRVFGAAINLRVPLLPSVAFHLGHGHAVYADAGKGVAHFIELEGLYDGDDELHGLASPGGPVDAIFDFAHDPLIRGNHEHESPLQSEPARACCVG